MKALLLLLLALFFLSWTSAAVQTEVEPYAIFAGFTNIMTVDVQRETQQFPQTLIRTSAQITGVGYHYKMRLLFWANIRGEVWRADLTDGGNQVMIMSGLGEPSNLVVDWISDKVFVADQTARAILEYDLNTEVIREVVNTGEGSKPSSIAVYPYPDYGWIFWYDTQNGVIERVGIDGQGRAVIQEGLSNTCVKVITLEYPSSTIFWADICTRQLKPIRLNGTTIRDPVSINMFSGGMCVFDGYIYWTDTRIPATLNKANVTLGDPITQVTSNIFSLLGDMDIVHPDKQPNGKSELAHTVSISGPDNPLLAGDNYTLTCTVQADLTPTLKWLDSDGEEINATTPHSAVRINGPVSIGENITLELTFDPIKLSHGGAYACISSISEPRFFRRLNHRVKVKVSVNNVTIEHSPNTNKPYTASQLHLTCSTHLNPAVDTPVQVRHTWTGPRGVVTSGNGITVSDVTGSGLQYQSTVSFSSLYSSDSGTYTCSSSADPNPSSVFLASSAITSTSTSFRAVVKVNISISYIPPDQYPDYSPPNYRAASSVSLRCVALGTTGHVRYRWSSTCSSCFASGSSSQTITENFLRACDIGVHTCAVTDGAGNTGSATITMNIVGAGIYVDDSDGTGREDGAATGAQPQNSYAVIDSGYYHYSFSSQRFSMYCCSNSTSARATFTLPNGYTLSSSSSGYNSFYLQHYNNTYRGCARLYISSYSYYHLRNYGLAGVYTCNIDDSHGNRLSVNIGLYDEGFQSFPSIYQLEQIHSYNDTLVLVCRTCDAPPTNIRWYRDDEELDINNDSITMETRVASRRNSDYEIALRVCDAPSSASGEYECEVGNNYGNISYNSTVSVEGLEISDCSSGDFVVGSIVRCTCSSTTSSRWYKNNNTILSSSDTVVIPVSTDSQGEVYTCQVNSPCGTEEESVTLDVTVPDDWANISISSNKESALHNTDYSLLCRVTTITGMNLPITVEWVGPDGVIIITSDGNGTVAVSEVESEGRASTLTLSFDPVFTTDGGRYTCRATVNVPWTSRQPAQLSHSIDMSVTTQAIFQLKMYPLPHCSKWEPDKAQALENSIKKEVQDAVRERCKCAFNSHAIHSGEFSCQGTVDPITNATYRAIVNGTADLLTADEIVDFIGDWRDTVGTLKYTYVYSLFRLRLVTSSKCKISIDSFTEEEC